MIMIKLYNLIGLTSKFISQEPINSECGVSIGNQWQISISWYWSIFWIEYENLQITWIKSNMKIEIIFLTWRLFMVGVGVNYN